tara:strand:+ start:289 stop:660 length:372 start_codon:yes stop_codon:yes gene_type:complete
MNNKTLIEQIEFIKTFLDEGLRRQHQKPSRWEAVKGKVGQVVQRIKRATVHDKVETNRNVTDHEEAEKKKRHAESDARYKKYLDATDPAKKAERLEKRLKQVHKDKVVFPGSSQMRSNYPRSK